MKNEQPDMTIGDLFGGILIMALLGGFAFLIVSYVSNFWKEQDAANEKMQRDYSQARAELNPNNLTDDQLFIQECQKTNTRFACVELLQQKQAIEEQKRTERTDFWLNFLIHR